MNKNKVLYLVGILIPIAFVFNGILIYSIIRKNVVQRVENSLDSQIHLLESIVDLNRNEALKKISNDIKVAHHIFYTDYKLSEGNDLVSIEATNQITKEVKQVEVKKWYLNGKQLQFNYKYVDELRDMIGGTATIFQRIDEGFLRISTNVQKLDLSRAVGTYIPFGSEVIDTILNGKTYYGRAYVVNDWYLTAYEPIWIEGEIKGMLYVGVKEKEFENLKKTLNSIPLGKTGYIAVLDAYGNAIVHPTHEGQDLSDTEVFRMIREGESGIIHYKFEGEKKIAAVKFYEPFQWYLFITMKRSEPYQNFLTKIQVFTIFFSLLISFIIFYLFSKIFLRYEDVIEKQKKDLISNNEKLEEINQTKDKLFSIVAHDLKNPFNALIGFSKLLVDNYGQLSDEKRILYSSNIYKSSIQNYNLLDNILQWSKSQLNNIELKKSEFDLHTLVNTILKNQLAVIDIKKVEIINNLPSPLLIYADENLMRIVFRNLISNAIKFSYENNEIKIYAEVKKKRVLVTVQDSGMGMSEEKLSQLFNSKDLKPEKGTNDERGTGLGLIICKEFIEMHGGNISVESHPGSGSKFFVDLPLPG